MNFDRNITMAVRLSGRFLTECLSEGWLGGSKSVPLVKAMLLEFSIKLLLSFFNYCMSREREI